MVQGNLKNGTNMAIANYLRKTTKRGNFSYRRSVPEDCRSYWGKREHKVSLKTKHHPEALRLAAQVNTVFEEKVKLARSLKSGEALEAHKKLSAAHDILTEYGVHPDQRPTTVQEARAFANKIDTFEDNYHEANFIEHINGWEPSSYTEIKDSPAYLAMQILEGHRPASLAPAPTIGEATDTYLQLNAEEAQRTEHNQRKHEQSVRRAVDWLGMSNTLITDFTRQKARAHKQMLRSSNPTWADDTLNRSLTILSAIFSLAIREYDLDMQNPWTGLTTFARQSDAQTSEDRSNKRRSFTPDELARYSQALSHLNNEARLIGLLMIQTGCRTMEAAGLLIKDVKLDTNVPHLQIRFNRIRKLKTKNSVRDVPLVGHTLDNLRDYLLSLKEVDPNGTLFPRYGRDGGMDSISSLLNGVIRKRLKISDRTLVAYSARHTMKDKLRALREPGDIQHRILGHGSKSQADGYGDGVPLAHLQEALVKADQLTEWGR